MAKKAKKTKKKVDGRGKSPNSRKNLIEFKPGVSGNPKGKPKGRTMKGILSDFMERVPTLKEIDEIVTDPSGKERRGMRELIQEVESQMKRKLTRSDFMSLRIMQKAMEQGDVSAFNAIINRTEGMPVQVNKNENVNTTYVGFLDDLDGGEEDDD